MNIEGVDQVLKAILEDEDDFDVKEIGHPDPESEGHWEQVGGDYGDPWVYGAEWYNMVKRELIHFGGVENEKEVDPDDVELPEAAMAKLKAKVYAQVHDPYLDTDEAKEDPAWLAKQLKDEEWDIEREVGKALGNYQYARAAYLNSRTRYAFYRLDVPESLDDYAKEVEQIRPQYGPDANFEDWPIYSKLSEIANYWGWEVLDAERFWMNKLEAQKFFGFTL